MRRHRRTAGDSVPAPTAQGCYGAQSGLDVGHHEVARVRQSGPTTTSTSSSTSTAGASWDGCSPALESQHLAAEVIQETLVKEGIGRDQLTIHSDRGAAIRSRRSATAHHAWSDSSPTADPMSVSTTPFPRASSRRSSTGSTQETASPATFHGLDFCRGLFRSHNDEHCNF